VARTERTLNDVIRSDDFRHFLNRFALLAQSDLLILDDGGKTLVRGEFMRGVDRTTWEVRHSGPIYLDGKLVGQLLFVAPPGYGHTLNFSIAAAVVAERLAHDIQGEKEKDSLADELISAYRELNLWYSLGDSISGVHEPEAICDYIIGQVIDTLQCESVGIYLLDSDKGNLRLQSAVGRQVAPYERDGLPALRSVFAPVVLRGETLAVRREADLSGAERELGFHWPMPLLAVPMRSRGVISGLLVAAGEKHRSRSGSSSSSLFASGNRRMLAALGSQAAVLLQNAHLFEEIRQMFLSTIQALADAVDAKDPYTHGHTRRVSAFAVAVGRRLGLSAKELEDLRMAAILHDVGKIGVPEAILNKPGRLTPEEFEQMKQHPVRGYQIVSRIPAMARLTPAILYHHERYDGKGYPEGLSGEEIPLAARILAVADAFDAMTSDRPYRPGMALDQAIEELKRNRGTQFDPRVVDAMLEYVESSDFEYDRILTEEDQKELTTVEEPGKARAEEAVFKLEARG